MKSKLLFLAGAAVLLAACGGSGKPLLPNVSGKAGEIIVVMEKSVWEGTPGESVRGILAEECPYLPFRPEPLYSLVNVTPGGFADLFKVHRNILMFNVSSQVDSSAVIIRRDVWAAPQCIVQINAASYVESDSLFRSEGSRILAAFDQAERDRVIGNAIKYENTALAPIVRERFGGSPHFPSGYKLKKATDDFVWIADEKQYTIQGIFIYSYPAGEDEPFSTENIISHRNEALQKNVPGMFENTYMITADEFPPIAESLRFRGRNFMQVRGLWEVKNDFMGGPFVSHSFYSEDGSRIIVAEAFLYSPKYDKRQFLRQVESIIYSWE